MDLLGRKPRHSTPRARLVEPHAADLALVVACLAGDARACAKIDQELRDQLARIAKGSLDRSDLLQALRLRLFVDPRSLASYTGQGPLAAWLRITALYATRSAQRRESRLARRFVGLDEIGVEPAASVDVELDLDRARVEPTLVAALRRATEELDDPERALASARLRGWSIDRLGDALGIDRSTAARRLERMIARLRRRAAEALSKDLGVEPGYLALLAEDVDAEEALASVAAPARRRRSDVVPALGPPPRGRRRDTG